MMECFKFAMSHIVADILKPYAEMSECIAKICVITRLPHTTVIEYLQRHSFDLKTLCTIVEVIKRLPTVEDKNNIRLLGLNGFLKFSRALI